MVQRQLSLPESASRFIDEQVATGRYASADAFVAELIDQERVRAAQARLAELVREGMESGKGVEYSDEWWSQLDEKVQKEFERRRSE